MAQLEDEYAIGLDLGTTYSCIGVYRNSWVEIMPNRNGNKITPSIVIIKNDGGILVGEETTNFLVEYYDNCIYEVKRLIGRQLVEGEMHELQKRLSFKIINSNKNNFASIQIKNKTYSPEEISSYIIKKMVKNAEKYLNKKITQLVITVPANFNDSQRKLTRQAAELLGLKVLRIINEPTAAALAYGFDENINQNKNILVFDLGGGTFDVSILSLKKNSIDNSTIFDVLGTDGDVNLGGEDFDNALVEYVLNQLKAQKGQNLTNLIRNNKQAMKKLKIACENIKKLLSDFDEAPRIINNIIDKVDLPILITKSIFEKECKPLFDKLIPPIDKALKMANLKKDQINEVILVGGSTRIPKIKEIVKNYFPKSKINNSINPDEAIAYGATIQAEKLLHNKDNNIKNFALFDITPFSLGTDVVNNSPDPEIKKEGHLMDVIIEKGSHIPVANSRQYSSVSDNQQSMSINIYEGEKKYVKYNHLIKISNINGLTKRRKGEAKIEMKFDIDMNGILNVEAKELSAEKNGQIVNLIIQNDEVSLSNDEMDNLKKKIKPLLDKIGNQGDEKLLEYISIKGVLKKYKDAYENCKNKEKTGEEEDEDGNDAIIYLSNYYTTLEEFINKLDKNFDNETVLSKFYLYIKDLFLHYLEAFNYELDKEDKNHIFEEINKNIQIFTDKNSGYLDKLLEILSVMQKSKNKNIKIFFYQMIVDVITKLNELGKQCLISDKPFSKYRSLIYFEQACTFYEKYFPKIQKKESDIKKGEDKKKEPERKNVGLLSPEYVLKIEQEGKKCLEYYHNIKSGTIILCEEFLEKGLLFNDDIKSSDRGFTNTLNNINIGQIKTLDNQKKKDILSLYEELLSKIQINKEFTLKEAVCIACILNINNCLVDNKIDNKSYYLLGLADRCEQIIEHLKIDKNQKWYQDFLKIYNKLKDNRVKEEAFHEIFNKIKQKFHKVFENIENKFKSLSKRDFVKFIITKYPYENIEKDNLRDFSSENSELIDFLLKKYNPDEFKYLPENEESELKYCIFHEIFRILRSLFKKKN